MQSMIVYALCVTVTLSDYVLPGIGIAGRFPVRPPPTTMKTVEDDSDSGVGRWLWIPPEENENDSDIDEIPEADTEEFPEEASTTQVRRRRGVTTTEGSTQGRRRREATTTKRSTQGRRRREATTTKRSTQGRRR